MGARSIFDLATSCAWPSAWDAKDDNVLDWKALVKISRPGWWIVHLWLYLAPTGQKHHLLSTWPFWLGLLYSLFPLNILVYGINDYTDVELDAQNTRKGNFMYGAKCTRKQMERLPGVIVTTNLAGIAVLAAVAGKWQALALWIIICFMVNLAYNVEPLRLSSKGPWELPCVVGGFTGVSTLSSIVNDIPWAPIGYWAHMTCMVLRTQIWTELLDYEPDLACGRRTTSTLVGRTWSKVLVVFFLALEGLVTWYFFDDLVFRLFSVSGLASFVAIELVRGTTDREKKKAMKVQNALGLSIVFWIWNRGLFAA